MNLCSLKCLAEFQSVMHRKSIAQSLKAELRTTSEERTVRRNDKTNNSQSSYRARPHSNFLQPEIRNLTGYTRYSVDSPEVANSELEDKLDLE